MLFLVHRRRASDYSKQRFNTTYQIEGELQELTGSRHAICEKENRFDGAPWSILLLLQAANQATGQKCLALREHAVDCAGHQRSNRLGDRLKLNQIQRLVKQSAHLGKHRYAFKAPQFWADMRWACDAKDGESRTEIQESFLGKRRDVAPGAALRAICSAAIVLVQLSNLIDSGARHMGSW